MIDEFIQLVEQQDKTVKITYSNDIQTVCNYLRLNVNTSNIIFKNCFLLPNVAKALSIVNIDALLDYMHNDTSANFKYILLPSLNISVGYILIFSENLEKLILKSYNAKKLSNLKCFW